MHALELHWIRNLQHALRGPITDPFFIIWNSFDSFWFVSLFTVTILYLFNRKEGISLLFIFALSSALNIVLKQLFHSPRPCQIDPSVGLLCLSSFGFPSGAAQTGTLIAGAAAAKCRANWLKIIGILFGLTLCFSRIYLGVHFITDVLGGIAVGICLLFIYLKLFPLIEGHFAKFAFCLTALFLLGGKMMLSHASFTLGLGIGLLCVKKMQLTRSWALRILSLLVVIGGGALLGKLSFQPLKMSLIGFWIIYFGDAIRVKSSSQS